MANLWHDPGSHDDDPASLKNAHALMEVAFSWSKRFKNLCGAKPCVAATQIRFELSLGRVWNYNVQELGAGGQWGFL